MNFKNLISKVGTSLVLTLGTFSAVFSQTNQQNLGQGCGCPNVTTRTVVNLSTLADVDGNLSAQNTILSCDKLYRIDKKIYVTNGKSLTINPGTVLKGVVAPVAGQANALIVSRGGQIFAPGIESCPIVFTADADALDGTYGITNKGRWGGVVVLGNATNNLTATSGTLSTGTAGVGFIEGFTVAETRNLFGAGDASFPTFDDNDNSGIMTYVSIRHAGDIAGAANELNGLTLGSVGRGTTLHHIEVVSNLDDGIEFFGGTVDLKYASVLFNDDDGFDWDLGWSGKGQFWVVVKTDQGTAAGGDNGFESDGDDGKINAAGASNPIVYNATYVGSNGLNGNATEKGKAIEGKEFTNGTIRNCVFAGYKTACNLNNDATRPGGLDAYDNWIAGTLKIENNTFLSNTEALRVQNAAPMASDDAKFLADGNVFAGSIAGFNRSHAMNTSTNVVSSTNDLVPSSNLTSSLTPAVDGFFTPATYRGAFEAGKKSWLSVYSINALLDLEDNLVPCTSDLNGDGTTNSADFLLLLGGFGTNCD